ncbi:MAG: integrase core domain-containing protein, partial [Proteiniphilum sp.]|nr:integrase core domain-containing protein [Proteiniphilum sp.]
VTTSENTGRRLENLIFLHLRKKYKQIFYYKDRGECDFIAMEKSAVKKAIQVCLNVDDENFDREYDGLLDAMINLGLKEGTIVGKGRAIDNIFIERFWRNIKYEKLYLEPSDNGLELYHKIKDYMKYYNQERPHQGLEYKRPMEVYRTAA